MRRPLSSSPFACFSSRQFPQIGALCAFLCLLLSLAASASAAQGTLDPTADRALPQTYRGVWAIPSCATPAEFMILEPDTILRAHRDGVTIDRLYVTAHAPDYIRIAQGTAIYFFEIDKDGALLQTGLRHKNGVWPETLDHDNPAVRVDRYVSCDTPRAPWVGLNADGLAAFMALTDIRAGCGGDPLSAAACARTAVTSFDRNADGTLDYGELARFWRGALYVAAALAHQCTFNTVFPGDSAQHGPQFAATVIDHADDNDDARLSVSELQRHARTLGDITGIHSLLGEMHDIAPALAPAVPESASALCPPISP